MEKISLKTMRKRKLIIWAIILCLVIGLIGYGLYYWNQEKKNALENGNSAESAPADYAAEEEIQAALEKLETNPERAGVITDITTVDKKVALCFEGEVDDWVLEQIEELLDDHDMTATFFISAIEVSENEETIAELKKDYEIESYTLSGATHMEELSQEELVSDFCRAQAVYEDKLGSKPTLLKCNATDYTQELLEAADASGYENVVYPTHYLNYSSLTTETMAQDYVKSNARGNILMVKLNGFLDEIEYVAPEQDEDPAKDKQPDVVIEEEEEEEELSEAEQLVRMVGWILDELEEEEYETVLVKDFGAQDLGDITLMYEGQEMEYDLAPIYTTVHTVDREMAFTFRGLGDEEEIQNVLAALDACGAKGTFFVTGNDIDLYSDQIRLIVDAGHEIGNGGYSGKNMTEMTFEEVIEDIYKNDIYLRQMGIVTDLFMPPYGGTSESLQRAATALDKKIINYSSAPIRQEYVESGYSGAQMVNSYYKDTLIVLCRGDIVYFNMAPCEDADTVASAVRTLWTNKIKPTQYENSILKVCTMSELLDNTWYYPASTSSTYNAITYSGNMKGYWGEMLQNGYIGNLDVNLKEFDQSEWLMCDVTGRINTGGTNTAFLTFDDWGNEQTIGKLLYVLKKHNVKATFFIKTQYVEDGTGENLLRAIAAEGHDVASHTDTHMQVDIGSGYESILQADLVKSNQVLSRVVGNTGRLTTYFRPPTLAISRAGMYTIFDCGYTKIISGDVSTADYDAPSVDYLYDVLVNGVPRYDGSRLAIQDGSIVVMHINTNAIYTPEAVDRYLTYMESLPDGAYNKFNFARLSDYLH